MGLIQGKYGTSITMKGKNLHNNYRSKLLPYPTTHRLDMTGQSQVISNTQDQVFEAFYVLQGTAVDKDCETHLAGMTLEVHIDLDLATFMVIEVVQQNLQKCDPHHLGAPACQRETLEV